jgi:hypothetical protein
LEANENRTAAPLSPLPPLRLPGNLYRLPYGFPEDTCRADGLPPTYAGYVLPGGPVQGDLRCAAAAGDRAWRSPTGFHDRVGFCPGSRGVRLGGGSLQDPVRSAQGRHGRHGRSEQQRGKGAGRPPSLAREAPWVAPHSSSEFFAGKPLPPVGHPCKDTWPIVTFRLPQLAAALVARAGSRATAAGGMHARSGPGSRTTPHR